MAPAPASSAEGADKVGTTDLKAPIIVVAPNDQWEHQNGDLVLGRGEDASVVIDDPLVSRKHARICFAGDGVAIVEDLNSTNGTFLNGTRMTRPTARLHDGDRLLLGTTELSVFAARPAVGTASASKRVCAIGLIRRSDPAKPASARSPTFQKTLVEEQTVQRQLFEPGTLDPSSCVRPSGAHEAAEPAGSPPSAGCGAAISQAPREAPSRTPLEPAAELPSGPPAHRSARTSAGRIPLQPSAPPISDELPAAAISGRSPAHEEPFRAPTSEAALLAAARHASYKVPAKSTTLASAPPSSQPRSQEPVLGTPRRPVAGSASDVPALAEAFSDPTCHLDLQLDAGDDEVQGEPAPPSRRGPGSVDSHSRLPGVHSNELPPRPSKPTTERSDTAELVGRLADRLVAAGKVSDAVRVLSEHLKNLFGGAAAGLPVPDNVLLLATRYALRLHEWTRQTDWIDYVFQLHLACQRLPSSASLDVLEPICDAEELIDRSAIEYLVHGLNVHGTSDSPDHGTRVARLARLAQGPRST